MPTSRVRSIAVRSVPSICERHRMGQLAHPWITSVRCRPRPRARRPVRSPQLAQRFVSRRQCKRCRSLPGWWGCAGGGPAPDGERPESPVYIHRHVSGLFSTPCIRLRYPGRRSQGVRGRARHLAGRRGSRRAVPARGANGNLHSCRRRGSGADLAGRRNPAVGVRLRAQGHRGNRRRQPWAITGSSSTWGHNDVPQGDVTHLRTNSYPGPTTQAQ